MITGKRTGRPPLDPDCPSRILTLMISVRDFEALVSTARGQSKSQSQFVRDAIMKSVEECSGGFVQSILARNAVMTVKPEKKKVRAV